MSVNVNFFCVRTDFSNITWRSFGFKGLKLFKKLNWKAMQATANTSTTNALSQQQKSTLMSLVAHALCICLQSTTSVSTVTTIKQLQ
jgi:hypothetical protein